MWWFFLLLLFTPIVFFIFLYRTQKHWERRGLKQKNMGLTIPDNWAESKYPITFPDYVLKFYEMFPTRRYVGYYTLSNPSLFIRDLDLIKQIIVKDFEYFTDHQHFIWEENDPLWSQNLFSLKGQKWREMRTTLSPTFTSSKIKYMFTLVLKNGEQFVQYFLDKNEDFMQFEMKDIFTRFTNDVIASSAFGVEFDSLREPENEFYLMSKAVTDFTGFWKILAGSLYFLMPSVAKFFNISLFPKKGSDFFNNLVKSNIQSRLQHGIVRPDMINIMLEARKHGLKHEETPTQDTGFATIEESEIGKSGKVKKEITDDDITSQALVFIFAGFETVSSMMCFLSYELALNPDIQKRLIQEIDQTLDSCDGHVTYEALMGMKYLDMVLTESLRKWPVSAGMDRVCTKEYVIEPKLPGENPVRVDKGTTILVPVFAIQRDPKYYPNPEKFDPERFSDGNKGKVVPYTFMPFGAGPRSCIGTRFAIMETKVLFFSILRHFEIVRVEKTAVPIRGIPQQITLSSADGFWLGFKRRVKV
ncbi:cytochrome P450 9e2-like [Tribolium madens]|uniref:cytochrome P450 9e2-like n=1 Tax=Tribolium madens TaxID=41895 RepID=UPI001CF7212F|nr:cytochrome P450 9e2-like [Tribolium madens]